MESGDEGFEATQVLSRLIYHLDAHEDEAVVSLFSPGATWKLPHITLVGHDEIRRSLAARPRDRLSCHIVTNAFANRIAAAKVEVRGYILVPRKDNERAVDASSALAQLVRLTRFQADLAKNEGCWKVDSFTLSPASAS